MSLQKTLLEHEDERDRAKPRDGLKPPQERAYWQIVDSLLSGRDVVYQSPTGSGKTRVASELLRWAQKRLGGGSFYLNRKSLIPQTCNAFSDAGLNFAVRAADHEEEFDEYAPVQISSADTERVRVYGDKAYWDKHPCGLVVVDEAHIQKGDTMQRILDDHRRDGAQVVLLSATPVSLRNMLPNPKLVVGGTIREFRDCGLLVPAVCRSVEQPDLRKVKRNQTGEYILDGQKKKIYTQQIVGNVLERWRRYNPDGRPTMAYWPGKPESVWGTIQFENAGVRWCHVDASEAYLDGKRRTLTRSLWQDILGQYKDGSIKGISSRFKLREGVDCPDTYQIILATPIGSLASYLQTVGRGLRAAPGKDHCLITDHGGNYLRHGSPNRDRPWDILWALSNSVASRMHEDGIRNREEKEPIRCPNCEGERLSGHTCPHCGEQGKKSQRMVLMTDGRLVQHEGDLIPKKRISMRYSTQRDWDSMYWGFKRKKVQRTFAQMEAFFVQQHGYWPPRTLNNMPSTRLGWHSIVHELPLADLITEAK